MDKCEVRQMNPEAIKSVRDAEAGWEQEEMIRPLRLVISRILPKI
ncbi:hypothetical protein [Abyssicoccus albus]|nr:hypothetical protein [Abyssicoccus albus]